MERERVRKGYSEGWGHGKEESMGMVIIIKGGIRREISQMLCTKRTFPPPVIHRTNLRMLLSCLCCLWDSNSIYTVSTDLELLQCMNAALFGEVSRYVVLTQQQQCCL